MYGVGFMDGAVRANTITPAATEKCVQAALTFENLLSGIHRQWEKVQFAKILAILVNNKKTTYDDQKVLWDLGSSTTNGMYVRRTIFLDYIVR